MGKLKTIFILLSSLLIFTCSKDDGYNTNESNRGASYSYSSSSYDSGGSASTDTSTNTSSSDSSSSGSTSSDTSSSDTSSNQSSSSTTTNSNYTINVKAQNSSDYILDGNDLNGNVSGNDPSISVKVGDTINFDVDASGHPLYLIISSNGGVGTNNLISGVTNNGAENGTITWTPSAVGTYYYICEFHSNMIGIITVTE